MTTNFSPYADWLGLPRELTKPNFYQLLRAPKFRDEFGANPAAGGPGRA